MCAASCLQNSCSAHADCVETVGNYTCQCHPGFQGPHCEEGEQESIYLLAKPSKSQRTFVFFLLAIACKPLLDPGQGFQRCFHPHGPNRFNSSCTFHCKLGFRLEGAPQLVCQASGQWNNPVPLCRGIATIVLSAVGKMEEENGRRTNPHVYVFTVYLSPEVPCFKPRPPQRRQHQLQPSPSTEQLQLHL